MTAKKSRPITIPAHIAKSQHPLRETGILVRQKGLRLASLAAPVRPAAQPAPWAWPRGVFLVSPQGVLVPAHIAKSQPPLRGTGIL